MGPVSVPPYLNNWWKTTGLEPLTIEEKHLYGRSSSPLHNYEIGDLLGTPYAPVSKKGSVKGSVRYA